MAGMVLLLMCTVAADERGWHSTQANRAADPAVTQEVPAASLAQTPLTGLPPAPPATGSVTADWSDIENALRSPPGNPSRSHAGFPALRSADGLDVPPVPPAAGGTGEQSPIPGLGEPPPLLPSGGPAPTSKPTGDAIGAAGNPGAGAEGQGRFPTQDGRGREIVFERNFQPGNFSDRQYISPPPRDTGTVVPVRNGDPRQGTNRAASSQPLPATDDADTNPAATDESKAASIVATEAKEQWWPLLLTMLGLFASLGFNVYLGWMAFDIHGRYHEIADEIQELEQKLEEYGVRTEASDRRRESRRHLAG